MHGLVSAEVTEGEIVGDVSLQGAALLDSPALWGIKRAVKARKTSCTWHLFHRLISRSDTTLLSTFSGRAGVPASWIYRGTLERWPLTQYLQHTRRLAWIW